MGNSLGAESLGSADESYSPVLRFDPDVLSHDWPDTPATLPFYKNAELLNIVRDYPEMKTEQILKMTIYRHLLCESWLNLIPSAGFYRFHTFIVFQTENCYYSVEKYKQRVSLQRAKELRGN